MKHECLVEGCAKKVDTRWAVCLEHWQMLPRDLTGQLARTYVEGMTLETATPGLRLALAAVHGWIRETFGAANVKGHDPGRWERLVRYVRDRDEARAVRRAADPQPAAPHLRLIP